MLTKEEQKYLAYWSVQREHKKRFLSKLSVGFPLGVLVVGLLLLNFLSGWYKKADILIRSNSSLIIVVLVAAIAIVAFITIFSARHKWDQNEQHYLELLQKQEMQGRDAANRAKLPSNENEITSNQS